MIRPALTVSDEGIAGHHPHVCSVSTAGCQPREGVGESYGQRVVRELAESIGERGGRGKRTQGRAKLPADMRRGLEAFGKKKKAKAM